MSDELSWKRWTPDDLSPPSAEFTPAVVSSDEGDAGAGEPELSEENSAPSCWPRCKCRRTNRASMQG